jgi:hypothetical protein
VTELFRWTCVGIAAVAAIVGISAGSNLGLAVPAALLAILAGGFAAWDTSRGPAVRATRPLVEPWEAPAVGVRAWFSEGSMGREEIVLLLDRLDREGPHPRLPVRPPVELRRLVDVPMRDFRAYVRTRLDQLEGAR